MNIDSNTLTINDNNQNTIPNPTSNHLHHSNNINIKSNENHSKSNKYYSNHYYTNNTHSNHYTNPLTHSKSHNQRSHSHRATKHQHHPPHTHSTSYHNHTHKTRNRNHRHGHSQSYTNNNHKHKPPRNNTSRDHEALSDSEIMDLSHNNHSVNDIKNGNQTQTANITTLEDDNSVIVDQMTLSPPHNKDETDNDGSDSESDEFKPAFPVKAIAFDLDKTMVRTISLHTNEQPQPEQHPNGYFMFFDVDTKEYHHVYKRPHLKKLLEFLSSEIVMKNRCKMMLCTHGTQKYAQTILEKCQADKLFPLMLPRKDWCRRKFEDDYKPRRFKTIEKMAKCVNERIEDIIMIDDDPGVYSKGDRCNGSLLHIKPFDDPYEQRDDEELNKLVRFLQGILKYGKNYYNKIFSRSIPYTGLVRSHMKAQEMAKHSLFRAQLMKRLMFDFNIAMNKQERLATLFLFDRYCAKHCIDWNLLDKNKTGFPYYVVLMFGCLFIARQYLYTDSKRPKQFRRDPYSAEIWLIHVDLYVKIVKKYKTMNGVLCNAQQKHHKHHKHHHHQSRHHHKASSKHSNKTQQPQEHTISMDDNQLITSYTNEEQYQPQQQQVVTISYHSQSHHRRKRKHKNREKQMYFTELHNITKQICTGIGYPKLLHGLFHRPDEGYDSSLFVKYEDYVESLYRHIEKTHAQTLANKPFLKFD